MTGDDGAGRLAAARPRRGQPGWAVVDDDRAADAERRFALDVIESDRTETR